MEMQSLILTLEARREQLMRLQTERQRGEPVDMVRAARIDLLNTAILALGHYDAPDQKIREALKL